MSEKGLGLRISSMWIQRMWPEPFNKIVDVCNCMIEQKAEVPDRHLYAFFQLKQPLGFARAERAR
jgi:hypothetical protein